MGYVGLNSGRPSSPGEREEGGGERGEVAVGGSPVVGDQDSPPGPAGTRQLLVTRTGEEAGPPSPGSARPRHRVAISPGDLCFGWRC